MADDEIRDEEALESQIPEIWRLAKPPVEGADDDNDDAAARRKPAPGAKVGKLVKLLNDIEDPEELDAKVQELDPASGQSLLLWATLQGKFVLVEWLVKKCKRNAFAFSNKAKEISVFDQWVATRKEIEEKEREKRENPPEEAEEEEGDEEKAPEPTADQLVYEALAEFHEEWGVRGQGLCKAIGELGVYQGARDAEGAKSGLGQTLFPNGDMFTGEYKANVRSGTGTYYWASEGMIYTGQWHNNVRHGVGRQIYPDGGRYYGSWVNDKRNGEGRYTYPDGSSYSGAWVDDVKHGFGTYAFVDGSQYVGTFVEGEFVSGEWHLAGGTRYFGSFQDGAPTGKGVFVFRYGQEGSYRQEGSYVDGAWQPGAIAGADATPRLDIVVQGRVISLRFSNECAGLTTEAMVLVSNFSSFVEWVRKIDANRAVFVDDIEVTGLALAADKSVEQVRLRVTAVDSEGARIRGADAIILRRPTTRLFVVLCGGDKTMAVLQQSPSAALLASEQLLLPTVNVSATGTISGAFVDVVGPALRLSLHASKTVSASQKRFTNVTSTSAAESVLLYIQHVHADTIATLQARLDGAAAADRKSVV